MSDTLALFIGLGGTVLLIIICALIVATVIWMWGGDWWTGQYNTFVDALELTIKGSLTLLGFFTVIAILVIGIDISWTPLWERTYNGSS